MAVSKPSQRAGRKVTDGLLDRITKTSSPRAPIRLFLDLSAGIVNPSAQLSLPSPVASPPPGSL